MRTEIPGLVAAQILRDVGPRGTRLNPLVFFAPGRVPQGDVRRLGRQVAAYAIETLPEWEQPCAPVRYFQESGLSREGIDVVSRRLGLETLANTNPGDPMSEVLARAGDQVLRVVQGIGARDGSQAAFVLVGRSERPFQYLSFSEAVRVLLSRFPDWLMNREAALRHDPEVLTLIKWSAVAGFISSLGPENPALFWLSSSAFAAASAISLYRTKMRGMILQAILQQTHAVEATFRWYLEECVTGPLHLLTVTITPEERLPLPAAAPIRTSLFPFQGPTGH